MKSPCVKNDLHSRVIFKSSTNISTNISLFLFNKYILLTKRRGCTAGRSARGIDSVYKKDREPTFFH